MKDNLLGVRVKISKNNQVKVLRFQMLNNHLTKSYLDDDGNWHPVPEGTPTPNIKLVYHEASDSDPTYPQ